VSVPSTLARIVSSLCVSHQSTLGRPVTPAAFRTCVGLNWSEGRRRGRGGGEGGVSACDVNGCVEEERTAEQARVYLFIVVVHLMRGRRTAEVEKKEKKENSLRSRPSSFTHLSLLPFQSPPARPPGPPGGRSHIPTSRPGRSACRRPGRRSSRCGRRRGSAVRGVEGEGEREVVSCAPNALSCFGRANAHAFPVADGCSAPQTCRISPSRA